MTAVAPTADSIDARLATVARPTPLMTREDAAELTARQRELLDGLTTLISGGFSKLTMADIAARLGCSLRTLYGIASSRDALVLLACDRNLWSTGRRARTAVGRDPARGGALEATRRYLMAATGAVSAATAGFSADLASIPGGAELARAHSEYLVAITTALLDITVEQQEIAQVDTNIVARVLAEIANVFFRPDVIDSLPGTPKEAADHVIDIVLRGLAAAPH